MRNDLEALLRERDVLLPEHIPFRLAEVKVDVEPPRRVLGILRLLRRERPARQLHVQDVEEVARRIRRELGLRLLLGTRQHLEKPRRRLRLLPQPLTDRANTLFDNRTADLGRLDRVLRREYALKLLEQLSNHA